MTMNNTLNCLCKYTSELPELFMLWQKLFLPAINFFYSKKVRHIGNLASWISQVPKIGNVPNLVNKVKID
jgi:hypothetical protein